MLKIYNSMTRQKEEFKEIEPGKIKLYVCGMTVYDYCHLGHARSMITFDMVVRYLRFIGYEVTHVRNITDIDDKIIVRAKESGKPASELTEQFIQAMHEDEAALGLNSPDFEPRATDHIPQIISMIELLIAQGFAYVADQGDVYFEIRKFEPYGALSNRNVDDLRSGARVEVQQDKRDPLDFALWKHAKPDEPSWDSPWGPGRPGWHIECSAMSTHLLGNHFDIHGGGLDLIFPHHENEIAQTEAAIGGCCVNTWMHAGLLQVNSEKMSKSLNNFFTIREVLAKHDAEVVRFLMLQSHYRKPAHYSDQALAQAHSALETLYTPLRQVESAGEMLEEYKQRFIAVMNDDFNTSEAIAILFEIAKALNVAKQDSEERTHDLATTLKTLANSIGLLVHDAEVFFQSGKGIDNASIEQLIEERTVARENKDWARSDQIRDLLLQKGVILEDGSNGTTWRRN